MKNQVLKTISILSLLAMLSVSAGNVAAFPTCPGCNKPAVQYFSSFEQTAKSPTVSDTTAVTEETSATSKPARAASSSTFIYAQLALFITSVF